MTSHIYQMYQNLEKCAESLEQDVKNSLQQLNVSNSQLENIVALEASKDQHYNEILNQLKNIKESIKTIAHHDRSLQLIQSTIDGSVSNQSKIDKSYIKKQVESFQQFGVVNRRENKRVRPPEVSSMKHLECWERILEDQEVKNQLSQALPLVIKREESFRRRRRVVSSTVDTFLESRNNQGGSTVEAINEEVVNDFSDTKPRIVDVIYKKDANDQICTSK